MVRRSPPLRRRPLRLSSLAAATVALVAGAACNPPDVRFTGLLGDALPLDAAATDAPDAMTTPPPQLRSCMQLPATCGARGTSYCCDSIEVPGGNFHRDFDAAGDASSGSKTYPATVSSFRLDTYDVTVGRFRAFVAAGMGTQDSPPMAASGEHPDHPGSGWDAAWKADLELHTTDLIAKINCSTDQTWTDAPALPPDPNENRPMNCLTWWEAMAFCIWDGGYLPSELELNYVEAGGDEQRAYAWSNPPGSTVIDDDHTSYSPDSLHCNGDGSPDCTATDLVPVGSKPAGNGRWGHADLTGTAYQWALDWFAPYPAACSGATADCMNLTMPPGPNPVYRVMRGGAFVYPATTLRVPNRGQLSPGQRNYINTVRCAYPM